MDKHGASGTTAKKKAPNPETLKKVNDLYRVLGIGQK